MGLFSAPKGSSIYYGNMQIRSQPELHRRKSHEDEKPEPEGDDEPEKPKIQEEKVRKPKKKVLLDPETVENTKINSMLYHTSDDTVDMYAQESSSSDLLGRLYYDNYDSDSMTSPALLTPGTVSPTMSGAATPLLSPSPGSAISNDYFTMQRMPSASNIKAALEAVSDRPKFERGVSFDTSSNTHKVSMTFKVKHPRFKFRRNNKTFLTGFNNDAESLKAIEWLFDELIIHGDTIVVLQVLDDKMHRYINKDSAQRSLEKIKALNTDAKKISLVFEIAVGKPQRLLKKAIDEYNPAMMVIGTHEFEDREGTHHHSAHHKSIFSKTTMSKYFLQYALVPVIVVKPTYKHVKYLSEPIVGDNYFQKLIANVELSDTYVKDKDKKKTRKLISPSLSRNSSSTSVNPNPTAKLLEERGRQTESANDKALFSIHSPSRSRSRSSSTSRKSFSKLFHRRTNDQ